MSLGLLFPGQGAQHAQMLSWLEDTTAAAPALASLLKQIGPDWRARAADPQWLHANSIAQPLLTGVSLAAWQAVAGHLPTPVAIAGYSVGEIAAFSAAGVYDLDTALDLAARRAEAMNAAAQGHHGGLLSVQGPSAETLAAADAELKLAIRISTEHVIVGGPTSELHSAAARWTAAGLRCKQLPIAVASHTPWMTDAAHAFAGHLATLALKPPTVALISNLTGMPSRQLPVLTSALSGQIAATVRWDDCLDSLAERGVRCVLEVGAGSTLTTMWRDRYPDIPARSADEFRSATGLVDWVLQRLA
ncbi:acyltransferase domain-containing protein [Roseateles sp. SL47]|uniref:acyltransferase domain-containing protein n=1 Tax=Roseateles sp. SL47 TaxID=2995138 RepID=UPI002270C462|nr:acyltransferase domain-containing protein [Roseateles sp. SL47]WAC73753.1 acyltransferase domain-containing protein [Roseateles sp. SL47]